MKYLILFQKNLGVNGNISEFLDKYFEYTNKQRKMVADEYDSQFKDYRDNDEEDKNKHINKELNELAKHRQLQKLNLNDVMMGFDATSLYPSGLWDEKYVHPKIETGFVFNPHKHRLNKTYVDASNDQTFNKDGNESAILRRKYYNPPSIIFQHLPVKEKVKNIEFNRMRNGYLIDTLKSVNIQEIVKVGGKKLKFTKVLFIERTFKYHFKEKLLKNFFSFKQNYKGEGNDLMDSLVKLIKNSLHGVQMCKDINESYNCNIGWKQIMMNLY